MGKNATIRAIWENSNHGTRLEDIQAAYEAGEAAEREACAKLCHEKYERHAANGFPREASIARALADEMQKRSNN